MARLKTGEYSRLDFFTLAEKTSQGFKTAPLYWRSSISHNEVSILIERRLTEEIKREQKAF